MGADLSKGRVVGDSIECPFHGWRYGPDGDCKHVPHAASIPSFAKQKSFATVERHGYVFFFNRTVPLFPLPFFMSETPDDFIASKAFHFRAKSSWYMLAAHAFDVQHFETVHQRRLLAPPIIDTPLPFARRNSYSAEVCGSSMRERVLGLLGGKMVSMSITAYGGTMFLLSGKFRRSETKFIINAIPTDDGECDTYGIVFARRGNSKNPFIRIINRATLHIRRAFTFGYLRDEARDFAGARYRPGRFIENDREVIDYFNWVVKLPGFYTDTAARRPVSSDLVPCTSTPSPTLRRSNDDSDPTSYCDA
jgi:hypothetical protein